MAAKAKSLKGKHVKSGGTVSKKKK